MAVKRREAPDSGLARVIYELFTSPESTAELAVLDPATVSSRGLKAISGSGAKRSFSELLSRISEFSGENPNLGGSLPTSVQVDEVIRRLMQDLSASADNASKGGDVFKSKKLGDKEKQLQEVLNRILEAASTSTQAGRELANKSSRPALLKELNSLAGGTQRRRQSEAIRNSLTMTALRGRDPFEKFEGRNIAQAVADFVLEQFNK